MTATLATTRFDLKMDSSEKDIVARAAALMGTTMAGFVRSAVKEKAQELIAREVTLSMSAQDFHQFSEAIQGAFTPNKAFQGALKSAAKVHRA